MNLLLRWPHIASLLALALATTFGVAPATAQTYPTKPVTLVVAYAAGGAIDIVMRIILPRVTTGLGQPVLMLNRPGAGGAIATDAVIAAGNDGYTLLVNGDQLVTAPHLMGAAIRHDIFRDLAPITRLITVPFALTVSAAVPANTLAEFIALAKNKSSKLTYGTPGAGTANQLAMEFLKSQTGADILHVPYKGAAAVMNELVAGRVDSIMISIQLTAPHVKSGKLRALAVGGPARASQIPGAPTFAETGFPEFDIGTTFGALAPAGTPEPIIGRLHAEFVAALRAPAARKQIEDTGTLVTADTPQEFAKKLRIDYERNGKIIRDNKIQGE